ncbi:MAG: dolichyl-phosphate-mannose--protein mannosyltransferase [bacterium]
MAATATAEPTEAEVPPPHQAPSASTLYPPMPSSGWRGWLGPLGVAALAGVLRFTELGRPHAFAFDEVYYAKDALALLRFGYEQQFVEDANDLILASDGNWRTIDVFGPDASFVVHPPFGKWVIAGGEWLFGVTPFGWRFSVAVLGTLAVLMIARIVRRLTRSDLLGIVAGLLLAVDGMHLVMSRTAVLDMVLSFMALAAFGLLLWDRDAVRRRFAGRVPLAPSDWGPALGPRPLRWAAGAALGLACAVKWSGLWYLAAFGLMTVVWDVGLRRSLGVTRPWTTTILRSGPIAFVAMVGSAAVAYLVTWSGWLLTTGGWGRDWADSQPDSLIPASLRSLWHYHAEAWNFHVGLESDHSYESSPLSWLFQTRPTSFYWNSVEQGVNGCDATTCASAVAALGNPVIWWIGVGALLYQLWRWAARRDWRSGAVLVGLAAGLLPWMLYLDRTIFTFYSVVFVPYIVMALTLTIGSILGPADAAAERRRWGAIGAGAIVLLAVIAGWWFYPVWTGEQIPYDLWRLRMWMPTWI